jgi:hypothetical protein
MHVEREKVKGAERISRLRDRKAQMLRIAELIAKLSQQPAIGAFVTKDDGVSPTDGARAAAPQAAEIEWRPRQ